MKFAVKYEVTVMDDDGNLVADAQANLNVTNVMQLVKSVQQTVLGVIQILDEADKPAKTEFENAMARAMSLGTEAN